MLGAGPGRRGASPGPGDERAVGAGGCDPRCKVPAPGGLVPPAPALPGPGPLPAEPGQSRAEPGQELSAYSEASPGSGCCSRLGAAGPAAVRGFSQPPSSRAAFPLRSRGYRCSGPGCWHGTARHPAPARPEGWGCEGTPLGFGYPGVAAGRAGKRAACGARQGRTNTGAPGDPRLLPGLAAGTPTPGQRPPPGALEHPRRGEQRDAPTGPGRGASGWLFPFAPCPLQEIGAFPWASPLLLSLSSPWRGRAGGAGAVPPPSAIFRRAAGRGRRAAGGGGALPSGVCVPCPQAPAPGS